MTSPSIFDSLEVYLDTFAKLLDNACSSCRDHVALSGYVNSRRVCSGPTEALAVVILRHKFCTHVISVPDTVLDQRQTHDVCYERASSAEFEWTTRGSFSASTIIGMPTDMPESERICGPTTRHPLILQLMTDSACAPYSCEHAALCRQLLFSPLSKSRGTLLLSGKMTGIHYGEA